MPWIKWDYITTVAQVGTSKSTANRKYWFSKKFLHFICCRRLLVTFAITFLYSLILMEIWNHPQLTRISKLWSFDNFCDTWIRQYTKWIFCGMIFKPQRYLMCYESKILSVCGLCAAWFRVFFVENTKNRRKLVPNALSGPRMVHNIEQSIMGANLGSYT